MTTQAAPSKKVHQGRNIKRFREMMGIKQDALAMELGDDWSQKKVSRLEDKETVDDAVLSKIASALKVPEDVLRNFDEDNNIFNIQHNYEGTSNNNNIGSASNSNFTFNPLEKLIALFEENKKLYERLLESEKEKVEILKKIK